MIETLSQDGDLCFEAELAFGSALDAWRARTSLDHGVEWHEALGTV